MTTWLFEFEFEMSSVKDAVLVLQVRSSTLIPQTEKSWTFHIVNINSQKHHNDVILLAFFPKFESLSFVSSWET